MSEAEQEVLLIDDDELWLTLLARALGRSKLRVSAFQSAEDALELAEREPRRFVLAIVDQSMPRIAGVEVLRRLKALNPELRTVVHTADPCDPALEHDFVDLVIPKATEPSLLLASLLGLIERGRAPVA